jgi:8-oxo-dGTP diphosphatase
MKAGIDYMGIGVGAIVEQDGYVLLLKRSSQARHNKGLWDLPGGEYEPGETLEQTVIREVREETGLIVEPQYQLPTRIDSIDGQHWLNVSYVTRHVYGTLDLNLERETFYDKRFFSYEDLPLKEMTKETVCALLAYSESPYRILEHMFSEY